MPEEIVGTSPAMVRFRKNLQSLAKDQSPLIITGEAGVGKSFLASHIHAAGPQCGRKMESIKFSIASERDQRIVLLGAEPPELSTSRKSVLERETTVLFKHVDHANRFIQDKLAESLASSTVTRLGSSKRHPLSARVILTFRSTFHQLENSGRLTPELMGILRPVRCIHIPSLWKRRRDIQVLSQQHAMKLYQQFCDPMTRIRGIDSEGTLDGELLELLQNHRWKENVRDLLAFIRTLVMVPFRGEIIEHERLELAKMARMVEAGEEFSLRSGLASVERGLVARAVQKLNRHKTRIARLLGISERALGRISGSLQKNRGVTRNVYLRKNCRTIEGL